MILLAYGPNIFARDIRVRELVSAKRIQYTNIFYHAYRGDEDGIYNRILEDSTDRGLFSGGKRILVIHDANMCRKQDEIVWERIMKRVVHDDVLCILLEKGTKENKKWEKEITTGVSYKAQFFKPYTQKEISMILQHTAHASGTTLDAFTAMNIYHMVGGDMYGALEEVKRLALLQKPITKQMLAILPEYKNEREVYEFARAICGNASLKEKLSLWEHMCIQKTDPYMLFGYLAKMAKKKELIKQLVYADEMVKKGKLEITQALEQVIIS